MTPTRHEQFANKDMCEIYLNGLGFTFERHEPWAFSSGIDVYRNARGEGAAITFSSPEPTFMESRKPKAWTVTIYAVH